RPWARTSWEARPPTWATKPTPQASRSSGQLSFVKSVHKGTPPPGCRGGLGARWSLLLYPWQADPDGATSTRMWSSARRTLVAARWVVRAVPGRTLAVTVRALAGLCQARRAPVCAEDLLVVWGAVAPGGPARAGQSVATAGVAAACSLTWPTASLFSTSTYAFAAASTTSVERPRPCTSREPWRTRIVTSPSAS